MHPLALIYRFVLHVMSGIFLFPCIGGAPAVLGFATSEIERARPRRRTPPTSHAVFCTVLRMRRNPRLSSRPMSRCLPVPCASLAVPGRTASGRTKSHASMRRRGSDVLRRFRRPQIPACAVRTYPLEYYPASARSGARSIAWRSASSKLPSSAMPLPAMSNAVPWSTEVRITGSPTVMFTPASSPSTLIGPWP